MAHSERCIAKKTFRVVEFRERAFPHFQDVRDDGRGLHEEGRGVAGLQANCSRARGRGGREKRHLTKNLDILL